MRDKPDQLQQAIFKLLPELTAAWQALPFAPPNQPELPPTGDCIAMLGALCGETAINRIGLWTPDKEVSPTLAATLMSRDYDRRLIGSTPCLTEAHKTASLLGEWAYLIQPHCSLTGSVPALAPMVDQAQIVELHTDHDLIPFRLSFCATPISPPLWSNKMLRRPLNDIMHQSGLAIAGRHAFEIATSTLGYMLALACAENPRAKADYVKIACISFLTLAKRPPLELFPTTIQPSYSRKGIVLQ